MRKRRSERVESPSRAAPPVTLRNVNLGVAAAEVPQGVGVRIGHLRIVAEGDLGGGMESLHRVEWGVGEESELARDAAAPPVDVGGNGEPAAGVNLVHRFIDAPRDCREEREIDHLSHDFVDVDDDLLAERFRVVSAGRESRFDRATERSRLLRMREDTQQMNLLSGVQLDPEDPRNPDATTRGGEGGNVTRAVMIGEGDDVEPQFLRRLGYRDWRHVEPAAGAQTAVDV